VGGVDIAALHRQGVFLRAISLEETLVALP